MQQHIALIIHHPESRDNRIAQLLATRGYHLDWYCPREGDALPVRSASLAAAVLFGGAMSANDDQLEPWLGVEYRWLEQFLQSQRPFLGICLGAQMLARVVGGTVSPHRHGLTEVGYYPVTSTACGADIFGEKFHAFHWHKEGITLPRDAQILAQGEHYPVQAFRFPNHAYGLQFHPEVTRNIYERWIQEVPHCCAWPGAQQPAQIQHGWRLHDTAIHAQTNIFLDHWLSQESVGLRGW